MNKLDLTRERSLALLQQMVLIRRFEEKCAELYGEGKIRGFLHLYVGEEAVAAGTMQALKPEDLIVATYREHGHALLRGVAPSVVMAEMLGRVTGCCRGRGGSMHLFSREHNFYGGWAIVGGGLPIAVGLALANKLQGRNVVTACYFGDGATDEGEFHESLNLAALWRLPILFLCENNLYSMGTFLPRHASDTDISHKPRGYGIPSEQVDGMDLLAVEEATQRAATAIRNGEGPQFIELRTYRFRAHSMYDAEKYRDRSEVNRWKEHDCLVLFIDEMRKRGTYRDGDLENIERIVKDQVEAAVLESEKADLERVEDLERFVYAETR